MARLRMGTCSWKFPSWHGLVYSKPRGIDYLREYAQRYDTVEIDQWFWSRFGPGEVSLPDPADVAAYRAAVPDGFTFTVKGPNSVTLTHLYKKEDDDPLVVNPSFLSASLMSTFLQLLVPLRDALGPIMFQFEYLNRKKMSSQDSFQKQFTVFARQLPQGYTYGVEVRNSKYLNDAYFRFLGGNGLIPVLLQGYWMPPVWEVYAEHRERILSHKTAVIRLLGPDREGIEELTGKRWDGLVAPKDRELPRVVDIVHDLMNEGIDVYINVNNHYEGSAPLTVERIRELM
jgi:uncharacterized protein YecE (DUF72 family)